MQGARGKNRKLCRFTASLHDSVSEARSLSALQVSRRLSRASPRVDIRLPDIVGLPDITSGICQQKQQQMTNDIKLNAARKVSWVFYLRVQTIDSRVAQVLKDSWKSPCRQGAFEKPKRIDIKCQTRLLSFISPLHSRQNDVPKHLYNILQSCHIIAGQWHLSETSLSPVCSNLTFGCSAPCCSALMPNLR